MTSALSNLVDNDILLPPNGFSNDMNGGDVDVSQFANQMDSELKRLLIDEKERNEQLKKYYETLKADYARSQSEVLELQTQLRSLIEENKMMQDKYKSMFEKMQQELRKKQLYIEDLKNKELDEVKLEKLKEELSHEIEIPYKDIVKQFEIELEKLQQECNKLRFEAAFLKSTNEHEKTEFKAMTEQLKLKHEVELNAMRKDRDMMRQKLQEINHVEANKIKEVLKENNNMKVKLKALIEENDELRQKLEHAEVHQSSLIRNNSKVSSDLTAKISLLESEKESLKHQNDNAYKETLNLNETIANNIRKIHDLERENTTLKVHIEEVQYNAKKDLSNLKFEFSKEKGEFARNKEILTNQIEDLKTRSEIAEASVISMKQKLDEKEREITKSVNSANEENWVKINELTNEKLDLESKLQILQKDFEYKTSLLQTDKDKSEEKVRNIEKQRDEVYRENNRLRALIADSDNVRGELEREQEKTRELYKKCHKLETELAANNGLEQELTEINLKLKNELAFYTVEMQKSKEHLQRMKDEYENRLADMKTQYVAEKSEYQIKYDELQNQMTKTNMKMSELQKLHETKKKQYQNYLKKIKNKTELLNAKLRELKIKEQAIKDFVPLEVHNRVKKQLQDLLKRHQEFRNVLTINQPNDYQNKQEQQQMSLITFPTIAPAIINQESKYVPSEYNKEMFPTKFEFDEIRERLDALTQKQDEHLKEIASSSTKVKKSIRAPNDTISPISHSPSYSITKSPSPNRSRIKLKENLVSSSDTSDDDQTSKLHTINNTSMNTNVKVRQNIRFDNIEDHKKKNDEIIKKQSNDEAKYTSTSSSNEAKKGESKSNSRSDDNTKNLKTKIIQSIKKDSDDEDENNNKNKNDKQNDSYEEDFNDTSKSSISSDSK